MAGIRADFAVMDEELVRLACQAAEVDVRLVRVVGCGEVQVHEDMTPEQEQRLMAAYHEVWVRLVRERREMNRGSS